MTDINPVEKANLFSKVTFSWMNAFIIKNKN
jgi:hypothetical protein